METLESTFNTFNLYCDGCTVAIARVTLRSVHGEETKLCGHHYHRHEMALLVAGWSVTEDTRESLLVTNSNIDS